MIRFTLPNAVVCLVSVQNAWISSPSVNKVLNYFYFFFKQAHVQTVKLLLSFFLAVLAATLMGICSQRLGPPGDSNLRACIWSLFELCCHYTVDPVV